MQTSLSFRLVDVEMLQIDFTFLFDSSKKKKKLK